MSPLSRRHKPRAAPPPALDEQARRLADRLPLAVYVASPHVHGAFTFMSAGVETMLGYPRSRWVEDRKLWLSSLHPEDRWTAIRAAESVRRGGGSGRQRYRLRDAQGRWRRLEDESWFEGSAEQGAVHGFWTDLTELRRGAADLEEARRDVSRLRRQLVRLMSATSHSLRTPARQLVSLADIIARRDADAKLAPLLDSLREAARAVERRLALLASYADSVLSPPRLSDIDAQKALLAALDDLEADIREKDALVSFEPLPRLRADPVRLQEVLTRLVDNAARHAGPRPRVHVWAQRRDADWVISVRDHGPGMERERLRWLFAPFDASEVKPAGLGPSLGLAVCRELVESMGGTIWASSEAGVGSTFSFSLPPSSDEAAP